MCAVRTSNSIDTPLLFFVVVLCLNSISWYNYILKMENKGTLHVRDVPRSFTTSKNRLWETWYNCIINCYLSLNDTITKEPPSQIKKRLVIRRCLQLGRKSPVTCFFVLILCLSRRWALLGLIIGALSDVYCRLYTYIFRVAYIWSCWPRQNDKVSPNNNNSAGVAVTAGCQVSLSFFLFQKKYIKITWCINRNTGTAKQSTV